MRYFLVVWAFIACGSAIAGPPALPSSRDGAWLRSGIKQHERRGAQEGLSNKEAEEAASVASYICGVVDLESYLAQRAVQLSGAVQGGKKKKHIDPRILDGMTRALPMLIPLMSSDFVNDPPSCDKAVLIVRDYLQTYPEMLPKDAEVIVERALLEAYSKPQ